MSGEVLNSLGINRCVNQICDVCMTQLVRSNIEIQTVDHLTILRTFASKFFLDNMLFSLTVLISVIGMFFDRPGSDIFPYPLKLSVREWISIPVGNNKL